MIPMQEGECKTVLGFGTKGSYRGSAVTSEVPRNGYPFD